MKALKWLGNALDVVRGFPEVARKQAGYQLYRVQSGLEPSDWKSMTIVGAGVCEIRIPVKDEFRVIYVAGFEEVRIRPPRISEEDSQDIQA